MPMDSPQALVQHVFNAIAERRFDDVAEFVEPGDLVSFYDQYVSAARRYAEQRLRSAADYLRDDPGIPAAVAEYFAAQQARHVAQGSFLRYEFADVRGIDDVLGLTPGELLARWLKARDPSYQRQLRGASEREELFVGTEPGSTPTTRRTVLGSVFESAEIAHVVYRVTWDNTADTDVKVASVVRVGGAWRMRYDHDFAGYGGWAYSIPLDDDPESELGEITQLHP